MRCVHEQSYASPTFYSFSNFEIVWIRAGALINAKQQNKGHFYPHFGPFFVKSSASQSNFELNLNSK